MSFEDTMTDADLRQPVLEPGEERMLAALRREPDLAVDGLEASLMSKLLDLFRTKRG